MNKVVVILFLMISTSGCTQLKQVQNLDELLVLKDYADEADAQEKWVAQETEKFDMLIAAVDGAVTADLSNPETVRAQFGEPVIIDQIQDNGKTVQRWLYRHPIQKLAADRVYLYFDDQDHLLRYEHVTRPSEVQTTSP